MNKELPKPEERSKLKQSVSETYMKSASCELPACQPHKDATVHGVSLFCGRIVPEAEYNEVPSVVIMRIAFKNPDNGRYTRDL
ncbi:jg19639 [Pararge aegeria aegeria]|uniref:Jg19639 protein n=1 Tax=Pararge aegeria aegeria TaxID=348720 RepID=A0A8S4SB80_9NEOP|nr:jg19639 [Pararge aegeria aegeria]